MRTSFLSLLLPALSMGCTPKPSTPAAATAAPSPTVAATSLGDEGCTRGDATPALDASKVTGHSFVRGIGPRAEEKATLPGGVPLTILHTGCAHYVEVFTFRLPHDGTPGPDYPWLSKTAELLKTMPVNESRKRTVDEWVDLLSKRSEAKPAYVLGEEIVVTAGFSSLSLRVKPANGESEIELVYDIAL